MTLERRYRRVLRALPREYRRAWEEDMVSTFLDSAPARVPVGERLSVLGLAVRLRLTGAYASPRALVRHRTRLPRLRAQRVGAGHGPARGGHHRDRHDNEPARLGGWHRLRGHRVRAGPARDARAATGPAGGAGVRDRRTCGAAPPWSGGLDRLTRVDSTGATAAVDRPSWARSTRPAPGRAGDRPHARRCGGRGSDAPPARPRSRSRRGRRAGAAPGWHCRR